MLYFSFNAHQKDIKNKESFSLFSIKAFDKAFSKKSSSRFLLRSEN